jgi:hypothetical protein
VAVIWLLREAGLAVAIDRSFVQGVESDRQLAILRTANCDQAQGFLLSRPIPSADVPAAIARFTALKARYGDEAQRHEAQRREAQRQHLPKRALL